jgi:hypothetical protein
MSAGAFSLSKYELDNDDIAPIRVQPETIAAIFTPGGANAAPAGVADLPLFAKSRGTRRSYGINARSVRIRFTGAVPDGYAPNSIVSIPILTPAVYNAIVAGASTVTYLGSQGIVIGKSSEVVR